MKTTSVFRRSGFTSLLLVSLVLISWADPWTGRVQGQSSSSTGDGIRAERYSEDYRSPARPAPEDRAIRKYAVDDAGPGPTNFGVAPVHDDPWYATVRSDRLEWRSSEEIGSDVLLWDVSARVGDDDESLYLESEGEWEEAHDNVESATVELLYGRSLTAFWDLRMGLRRDLKPDPKRTFGVVGLTGMAPQWIETDLNLNVGESGDYRLDLESEYNLMFSQRLVLQPRLETEFAFREQPELDLGEGFTNVELGARLRYEFYRKFAPYVGVSWESPLGETRDLVRGSGEDPDTFFLVAGLRFWY